MDAISRLAALSEFLGVEVDEDRHLLSGAFPQPATCPIKPPAGLPIHMSVLPNGKRMPILKTLITSACEKNCTYCAFRAGRDFKRETFTPDDMAQMTLELTQKNFIQGAFLSSGVAGGGVRTQDKLIDAAEILRHKMGYRGYIHLKIMPGAERAQVERALQLADRVSINLEAPNTPRLLKLAPMKQSMEALLQPLRWVDEIRRSQPPTHAWKGRWPSTTTQFVAGGSGENDLELLETTFFLTRQLHLSRVYFSGFSPVIGTPLENQPAISPWREHRLYQASFLIRDYGFDMEDLPFTTIGDLPLEVDPKLAWARDNLSQQPLEINQADYHELLRIPGIGPHGARAILSSRTKNQLRSLEQLKTLGVVTSRCSPFILLDGHQPAQQLALF